MHITELAKTLPFGLHDAELSSIAIDYVTREARLAVRLWVDTKPPPQGESGHVPVMRAAELKLTGLDYLTIGPPASGASFDGEPLDITGEEAPPDQSLRVVAKDSFAYSFFVSSWNGNINFVASSAELRWLEEGA